MTTTIFRFLNIIIAALLAGVSFAIWIGFSPFELSPSAYLEQQQNMLKSLRVLMVLLVVIATIITIISAFLQKSNKSVFGTLISAALFFIACILITVLANKPIDAQVLTWTADHLPANWTVLRSTWWTMHILRTITELIALCLITWASIKKD
jgi:hypothetical protein